MSNITKHLGPSAHEVHDGIIGANGLEEVTFRPLMPSTVSHNSDFFASSSSMPSTKATLFNFSRATINILNIYNGFSTTPNVEIPSFEEAKEPRLHEAGDKEEAQAPKRIGLTYKE